MQLKAHDFFTEQPVQNAAVYLMRVISHSWSDKYARQILARLRQAAGKHTKLVLIDQLIPYACPDSSPHTEVTGAEQPLPPVPLLANLGKANAAAYLADIQVCLHTSAGIHQEYLLQMCVVANGEERTLGHFVELFASAGWRLERIHSVQGSIFKHIVGVPV